MSDAVEPPTVLVRQYAVRQDNDDLDAFVDQLMTLIDQGYSLVDVSRHDRRGDLVELRVIDPAPGGAR